MSAWRRAKWPVAAFVILGAATASAQRTDSLMALHSKSPCSGCAEWNAPQQPFKVFGNSYFVGTHGLSSVLITSSAGHILIDGGLQESAREIANHITAVGFRISDVKLIVNSHVHYDHAGGIAALQSASGARVAASPSTAAAMRRGASGPDDPQFEIAQPFPRIEGVREIANGDTLRVGNLAIVAHFTPGHTPGGTSWTWRSCEQDHCLDMVYADSQTPVSADNFLFTRNTTYPRVVDDFRHSEAVLESLSCDILITPHPDASDLWKRVAARDAGNANALVDREACKRYAANARTALEKRIVSEAPKR